MLLTHLATRLYNTPLLIQPAKLDAILAVLGERVGWTGPELTVPIPAPRAASPSALRTGPSTPLRASPSTPLRASLAVIPVYGSLVRRNIGVDAASGLTSYADIARQLDQALADPAVQAILLDVDSPGGEAGGVFELGERVRAASAIKPVWAVASDAAFSAAYAIACGASRLLVSRTGGVGSIGVIALHVDQSLRDAQQGFRFTAIYAGDRKNDFSPHAPLSDSAAARLQAEVDRLYSLFVGHVAGLRGLGEDAIRATEAGLFFGPEAVSSGLADAEGGLDIALSELADFMAPPRMTRLVASSPLLEKPLMNVPESPDTPDVKPIPGSDEPESGTTENVEQPAERSEPNAAPAEPAATAADSLASAVPVSANAAASPDGRAEALAIAELCQLAGQPQRIAGFLAEGATPDQVRRALLASRADSPEIASRLNPDAPAQESSPEHGPLMRAVRRMIGAGS